MTEFTADGIDRTTTLKVSGLTCGHCVAHVTEELEEINGVKDVSVLLNKGGQSTVTVLSDVRLEDTALAEIVRLDEGDGGGTSVIVIVRWPGSDPADRASAAARVLYGFTAAEAAVAAYLLNGLRAQAVAERMDVSISTVRSHIRSTFLKAGVNSQIEMLAAIRCRI